MSASSDDGDAVFSIAGTPEVGQTLTATLDTADPDGDPTAGYSYQWQILQRWHPSGLTSPVPRPPATTLSAAEEGRQVRVLISYVDGQGFSESVSTASVGVGLTNDGDAVFSIAGTPAVGETLTASLETSDPDGDPVRRLQLPVADPPAMASAWADISGATASSYELTAAEEGQQVRVCGALHRRAGLLRIRRHVLSRVSAS